MWRNYLTVGIRALAKNKTYAFINIFGLAIGMAACLMILLYVRYEISYDRWIPESGRVYQVQSWYKSSETGQEAQLQMTPYAAGKSLATGFPADRARGLRHATTIRSSARTARRRSTEDYLWVDGNFLEVDAAADGARRRQRAVAGQHGRLTQSEARRRFGTDNVVGRTMTLITRGVARDFRITGVLARPAAATRICASTA